MVKGGQEYSGDKDPYEYLRQSRFGEYEDCYDEWQSYWSGGEEEERELSRPYLNDDDFDETRTGFTAPKKSILDPGVDPYELNNASDPYSTDEFDSDDEVVLEEPLDPVQEGDKAVTVSVTDKVVQPEEVKAEHVGGDWPNVNEPSSNSSVPRRSFKRQSLLRRRRGLRSSLVEEVIVEENEEDLAAEDLEVSDTSLTLTSVSTPIKSILKRSRSATSSDFEPIEEEVDDMGAVASTDKSQVLSRSKEARTEARRLDKDEEEWSDYDKIIVSHNLAEEILDEIYGKLDDQEQNEMKITPQALASQSTAMTKKVEEAKSKSSVSKTVVAAAADCFVSENDDDEMTTSFNKSMADEILDELYGSKVEVVEVGQEVLRSPKTRAHHGRSRDDSTIPDNKAIFGKSATLIQPNCTLRTYYFARSGLPWHNKVCTWQCCQLVRRLL